MNFVVIFVITNLLINADQAMLQGGTIKIRAEELTVTGETDICRFSLAIMWP